MRRWKAREFLSGRGACCLAGELRESGPALASARGLSKSLLRVAPGALCACTSSTTNEVRPGRLELPPGIRRTRPSALRVYQFRHRRVDAPIIEPEPVSGRGACSRPTAPLP